MAWCCTGTRLEMLWCVALKQAIWTACAKCQYMRKRVQPPRNDLDQVWQQTNLACIFKTNSTLCLDFSYKSLNKRWQRYFVIFIDALCIVCAQIQDEQGMDTGKTGLLADDVNARMRMIEWWLSTVLMMGVRGPSRVSEGDFYEINRAENIRVKSMIQSFRDSTLNHYWITKVS